MQRKRTNLFFLVGFMGSGKSYVGKKVADILGLTFLDTDTLIEEKANLSIKQIFDTSGSSHFRQLETEILQDLVRFQNDSPKVIATGGGAPCFNNNMQFMNEHGVTFYLESSPILLTQRLINERIHRPLLQNLDETELQDYIEKTLAQRDEIYKQSHHIIPILDNSNAPVERISTILKASYLTCH